MYASSGLIDMGTFLLQHEMAGNAAKGRGDPVSVAVSAQCRNRSQKSLSAGGMVAAGWDGESPAQVRGRSGGGRRRRDRPGHLVRAGRIRGRIDRKSVV